MKLRSNTPLLRCHATNIRHSEQLNGFEKPKTLFKTNVTVLLLVLINNVNISRLNRIGRQLQPVELAAGELAVNWQTTSAW